MTDFHTITIEQGETNPAWRAYGHGTYPEWSVLAGQSSRVFLETGSLSELKERYPDAVQIEGTSRRYDRNASLEEISGLPEEPPEWFDPLAAGETW